ncbi:MAG: class I SAM-dependent methyltransferase [Bacteroidota bacterium]
MIARRLILLLVFATAAGCGSPSPAQQAATGASDTSYVEGPASRDGIGKFYMGREISQVMGHRGAGWLERPGREAEEKPEQVIDAMDLAPDAVVADIGAGTGYFAFRIAQRVPEGRVLGVDIQPEMLQMMSERALIAGVTNVEPVRGRVDDPNLPANTVDAALLVDAYHEFSHPREMQAGLLEALKPGGRVFLVEYRGEDPSVPIKPLHKMTEAQARLEWEAAGFTWQETLDFLPQQHVMVFTKGG